MKRNVTILAGLVLLAALAGYSETEDHAQKSFTIGSGGKVVLDVYGGSIELTASDRKDVAIDVFRKASLRGFDDQDREREEMKKHEVTFTQEGNTVIVRAQRPKELNWNNKINF